MNNKYIAPLVQIILIVSALNWGLVAYNGKDLVALVTKGGKIEQYTKFAIALAGVYAAYELYLAHAK
jgi:uncharacterized membrane protein YuzA (DUF378 family)